MSVRKAQDAVKPSIVLGDAFVVLAVEGKAGRTLRCWGDNEFGQLGLQSSMGSEGGTFSIPGVKLENFSVAAGGKHTVVLTQGVLHSMGDSRRGKLGHSKPFGRVMIPKRKGSSIAPKIGAVTAKSDHNVAISADGDELYAWGVGQRGSLGISRHTVFPVVFRLPTPVNMVATRPKAIQVAVGAEHCLALTAMGNLYSWGTGRNGRLGHGNNYDIPEPKRLGCFVGGTGQQIVQVAAGEAHSMARDEMGQVYSWGSGSYGRLGNGGETDVAMPATITGLENVFVTWIACSQHNSLAVCRMNEGTSLYTWGSSKNGQLGFATDVVKQLTPHPVFYFTDQKIQVVEAQCGANFTVCKTMMTKKEKKRNREVIDVYAWGKANFMFSAEVEAERVPHEPTLLEGLEYEAVGEEKKLFEAAISRPVAEFKARARKIAVGESHSIAILHDGRVAAWGSNSTGQLGVGTIRTAYSPLVIQLKYAVKDIACGTFHSLALTERHIFSWGSNTYGQLGLSDTKSRNFPCLIQTLQGSVIRRIAAGGSHSAAVCEGEAGQGAQIVMWGSNEYGQLGLGEDTEQQLNPKNLPALKVGGRSVRFDDFELALGHQHSLILGRGRDTSELLVCGSNAEGQLGIGGVSKYFTPMHLDYSELMTRKSKATKITHIAAGRAQSALVLDGKELYMWGILPGISAKRQNKPKMVNLRSYIDSPTNSKSKSDFVFSVNIRNISLGYEHGLALVRVNKKVPMLLTWGISSYGRLGIGNIAHMIQKTTKSQVQGEDDEVEEDVAAAMLHEDTKREINPTPVNAKILEAKSLRLVKSLQHADQVAASKYQSFAINSITGEVFGWGNAAQGILGLGTKRGLVVTDPKEIPAFDTQARGSGAAGGASDDIEYGKKLRAEINAKRSGFAGAADTKHDESDAEGGSAARTRAARPAVQGTTAGDDEKFVLLAAQNTTAIQAADLQRKIKSTHVEYIAKFKRLISSFDIEENAMTRAKQAIAARLVDQKLISKSDAKESFDRKGLDPLEQCIGRVYLDPMIMFAIFKQVYKQHKNSRSAGGETKSAAGGYDSDSSEDGKEQTRRGLNEEDARVPFLDLLFSIYDLNRAADRRRFQVFLKLALDFVLDPRGAGEQRWSDIFSSSDGLVFSILSRALMTGWSRQKLADVIRDLFTDNGFYEEVGGGQMREKADVAVAEFYHSSVDNDEKDQEGEDEDEDGEESQLPVFGQLVVEALTSSGNFTQTRYLSRIIDACRWILDVVFVCIESRVQESELTVKAFKKRTDAKTYVGSFGTLGFRTLARRRFSIAIFKAIMQLGIETTHYRRVQRYYRHFDNANQKNFEDTEVFLLHMLRGPKSMQSYIRLRAKRPFTPKGCTREDFLSDMYSDENQELYGNGNAISKKLVASLLKNGLIEKHANLCMKLLELKAPDVESRMDHLERMLQEDFLVIRSSADIRKVQLDWHVVAFLVENTRIAPLSFIKKHTEASRISNTRSRFVLRLAPFYITRKAKIVFNEDTRMWNPENIGSILMSRDFEALARKAHRHDKDSKERAASAGDPHHISTGDCLVMYRVMNQGTYIEIMRSKTGEGAWSSILQSLRVETESLKDNPTLKEHLEKAKNSLSLIKESKYGVLLGDGEGQILQPNSNPSQLFIYLRRIALEQAKSLGSMENNLRVYEHVVKHVTAADRQLRLDIDELKQLFLNVTGPHQADLDSESRRLVAQKRDWKAKLQGRLGRRDESIPIGVAHNPLYEPGPVDVEQASGRVVLKKYRHMRRPGCIDYLCCQCRQYHVMVDKNLQDPSGWWFSLSCCWPTEYCCLRQKQQRVLWNFLNAVSFAFFSTSQPGIFQLKLSLDDPRETGNVVLLHARISLNELKRHHANMIQRLKVVTDQPQPDGLEAIVDSTHPRSINQVHRDRDSVMIDTSETKKSEIQHKRLTLQKKNHLFHGRYFVFFDPLGSPVEYPHVIPFTLKVRKLIKFLTNSFPIVPRGFLAELDPADDPMHSVAVLKTEKRRGGRVSL